MRAPEEYADELATYREGFAANVRRLREEHKPTWSQTDLHNATRLHRTEIGRIENGETEPRLGTLHILAAALGVSLDRFTEGLPVLATRKPPPPRPK
jgi:transcriptional regulator with XRE-family HTH domain